MTLAARRQSNRRQKAKTKAERGYGARETGERGGNLALPLVVRCAHSRPLT